MNTSLELRPAGLADATFLCELYASTRQEELAPLDWSADQKRHFLRIQFRAQHLSYQKQFPHASFDVVLLDGCRAGRLYVDRREDEIRVIDIALLPEHRCRGIGRRLLEGILEEAGAAGLPVRIHVERYNRALSLYERLGFRRVGDTGVYYLMEWSSTGSAREERAGGSSTRKATRSAAPLSGSSMREGP